MLYFSTILCFKWPDFICNLLLIIVNYKFSRILLEQSFIRISKSPFSPYNLRFRSHTRLALKFASISATTPKSLFNCVWNVVIIFIGCMVLICLLLTVIRRDFLQLQFKIQLLFLVTLFMNNTSRRDLSNNKQSLLRATRNCILSHRHIFSFIKYYDVLLFIIAYLYKLQWELRNFLITSAVSVFSVTAVIVHFRLLASTVCCLHLCFNNKIIKSRIDRLIHQYLLYLRTIRATCFDLL